MLDVRWVLLVLFVQSEAALMQGIVPEKNQRRIFDQLIQGGLDVVVKEGEVSLISHWVAPICALAHSVFIVARCAILFARVDWVLHETNSSTYVFTIMWLITEQFSVKFNTALIKTMSTYSESVRLSKQSNVS